MALSNRIDIAKMSKLPDRTNGARRKLPARNEATGISPLGKRLREISDRALASGVKPLSCEQIEQIVAEIRNG